MTGVPRRLATAAAAGLVALMAVLMAVLMALLVGAPPVRAADGVDTTAAVAAFKGGAHLWVGPGGSALVDAPTQAKITAALRGSKVWLAVVGTPAFGPAEARSVTQALSDGTGKRGSYVLLGRAAQGGTFLETVSPVNVATYRDQANAAVKAHRGHPGDEALAYVSELATDPVPGKPFPTGAVVGTIVVVGLVLLLFLVVGVRQRRRRRARDQLVGDVRVELDSLTDDLLSADPAGRVALRELTPDDAEQRALRVAWSRQQAAEAMLGRDAGIDAARRARTLVRQGREALEHALRLRAGVPPEAEVLAAAAAGRGPDPAQRRDQAGGAPAGRQRMLPQWTAASYPGYGYGWYPGYGYGFFDYGGSFITGLLAGELLADAFTPWGGYGGFGAFGGYDTGFEGGYDGGYDSGYDASGQGDQGGFVSGDPGYVTDPSYDAGADPYAGGGDVYSGDPGYTGDAGSYDSGGFDSGGFDGGGFDGGGGSDT